MCCINRAGLLYPCEFRLWYSFHADFLAEWGKQRPGPELHSCRPWAGVRQWPCDVTGGSSAMNAVRIALQHWGFGRIVLAGVPLSGMYGAQFGDSWRKIAPVFAERVRSMSGLTMELFGRPSAAFVGA